MCAMDSVQWLHGVILFLNASPNYFGVAWMDKWEVFISKDKVLKFLRIQLKVQNFQWCCSVGPDCCLYWTNCGLRAMFGISDQNSLFASCIIQIFTCNRYRLSTNPTISPLLWMHSIMEESSVKIWRWFDPQLSLESKDRLRIRQATARCLTAEANPIYCSRREQTVAYLRDSL